MSVRNGIKKLRNEFFVNVYRWFFIIKIDVKLNSINYIVFYIDYIVFVVLSFLFKIELIFGINF